MDSFWNDQYTADAIVVRTVMAVAVYTNESGDIVIRQQDSMGDEDDVVVVPRERLEALIEALQRQAEPIE